MYPRGAVKAVVWSDDDKTIAVQQGTVTEFFSPEGRLIHSCVSEFISLPNMKQVSTLKPEAAARLAGPAKVTTLASSVALFASGAWLSNGHYFVTFVLTPGGRGLQVVDVDRRKTLWTLHFSWMSDVEGLRRSADEWTFEVCKIGGTVARIRLPAEQKRMIHVDSVDFAPSPSGTGIVSRSSQGIAKFVPADPTQIAVSLPLPTAGTTLIGWHGERCLFQQPPADEADRLSKLIAWSPAGGQVFVGDIDTTALRTALQPSSCLLVGQPRQRPIDAFAAVLVRECTGQTVDMPMVVMRRTEAPLSTQASSADRQPSLPGPVARQPSAVAGADEENAADSAGLGDPSRLSDIFKADADNFLVVTLGVLKLSGWPSMLHLLDCNMRPISASSQRRWDPERKKIEVLCGNRRYAWYFGERGLSKPASVVHGACATAAIPAAAEAGPLSHEHPAGDCISVFLQRDLLARDRVAAAVTAVAPVLPESMALAWVKLANDNGATFSRVLRGHDGPVRCCASLGRLIVTGGSDKAVLIYIVRSEVSARGRALEDPHTLAMRRRVLLANILQARLSGLNRFDASDIPAGLETDPS